MESKHEKIPFPITHPFCLFPHKIGVWVFSPKLDNSRLFYFENLTYDPPTDSRVSGKGFLKKVIICNTLVSITNPRSIIIGLWRTGACVRYYLIVLAIGDASGRCIPPSLMRQCMEHKGCIRMYIHTPPHMPTTYLCTLS